MTTAGLNDQTEAAIDGKYGTASPLGHQFSQGQRQKGKT